MTHETLMSKIVKIFQGPTDRPTDRRTDRPTNMTTPRSSDPERKNKLFRQFVFFQPDEIQKNCWNKICFFSI